VSLLNPTCHKQRASSWERATGVGSQLGKLLAPEGRPGSRLLPGVADMDCGPEAEKRGFWPAWRRREGGGKPAQSRSGPRATCLIDTQVVVLKARKNQGKPACQRSKIEWEIGKLRLRENRRSKEERRRRLRDLLDCYRLTESSGDIGVTKSSRIRNAADEPC